MSQQLVTPAVVDATRQHLRSDGFREARLGALDLIPLNRREEEKRAALEAIRRARLSALKADRGKAKESAGRLYDMPSLQSVLQGGVQGLSHGFADDIERMGTETLYGDDAKAHYLDRTGERVAVNQVLAKAADPLAYGTGMTLGALAAGLATRGGSKALGGFAKGRAAAKKALNMDRIEKDYASIGKKPQLRKAVTDQFDRDSQVADRIGNFGFKSNRNQTMALDTGHAALMGYGGLDPENDEEAVSLERLLRAGAGGAIGFALAPAMATTGSVGTQGLKYAQQQSGGMPATPLRKAKLRAGVEPDAALLQVLGMDEFGARQVRPDGAGRMRGESPNPLLEAQAPNVRGLVDHAITAPAGRQMMADSVPSLPTQTQMSRIERMSDAPGGGGAAMDMARQLQARAAMDSRAELAREAGPAAPAPVAPVRSDGSVRSARFMGFGGGKKPPPPPAAPERPWRGDRYETLRLLTKRQNPDLSDEQIDAITAEEFRGLYGRPAPGVKITEKDYADGWRTAVRDAKDQLDEERGPGNYTAADLEREAIDGFTGVYSGRGLPEDTMALPLTLAKDGDRTISRGRIYVFEVNGKAFTGATPEEASRRAGNLSPAMGNVSENRPTVRKYAIEEDGTEIPYEDAIRSRPKPSGGSAASEFARLVAAEKRVNMRADQLDEADLMRLAEPYAQSYAAKGGKGASEIELAANALYTRMGGNIEPQSPGALPSQGGPGRSAEVAPPRPRTATTGAPAPATPAQARTLDGLMQAFESGDAPVATDWGRVLKNNPAVQGTVRGRMYQSLLRAFDTGGYEGLEAMVSDPSRRPFFDAAGLSSRLADILGARDRNGKYQAVSRLMSQLEANVARDGAKTPPRPYYANKRDRKVARYEMDAPDAAAITRAAMPGRTFDLPGYVPPLNPSKTPPLLEATRAPLKAYMGEALRGARAKFGQGVDFDPADVTIGGTAATGLAALLESEVIGPLIKQLMAAGIPPEEIQRRLAAEAAARSAPAPVR